jgi:hypothetical protein
LRIIKNSAIRFLWFKNAQLLSSRLLLDAEIGLLHMHIASLCVSRAESLEIASHTSATAEIENRIGYLGELALMGAVGL